MKKILLFLCLNISMFAMDKNPFIRSMSIPGALKPSEKHSPTTPFLLEQMATLQSVRLVNTYATTIANAATRKLLDIFETGKKPGSSEVTKQLEDDCKKLQDEIVANEKNKKKEAEEEKGQYKTHRMSLNTEACVLHLAATINAGIAYTNATTHPLNGNSDK